ncbi:MAG: alpha-1,4-glucan--maltose-1-phosphate maltosyltransferase [Chloroflexota bacterium]|nr:alpha-1,4-glucan--maltose-1-phosphate maltosyltransferase [Chloroflexota bacterium]
MTTTRAGVRHAIGTVIEADEPDVTAIGTRRSIIIERIDPELDGGRFPVKRVVGDQLLVTADIFADGHDLLDAAIVLRADDEATWRRAPMRPIDNDRWSGHVELLRNRRHVYAVEAWRDAFGSWRDGLIKKLDAGVAVPNELEEGMLLLAAALGRAEKADAGDDALRIGEALAELKRSRSGAARAAILMTDELLTTMRRHADLRLASRSPELPLIVDRERARFGAWYELFPRSQGRDSRKPTATTFAQAEWRLPHIAAMGFDVVYLPPIHPIGRTNRKGRNNTLDAGADDVGSPYAIGSSAGGHDAVAPELGGLTEFLHFREAVEAQGMEVAMDLAIQAAPDHPYVARHPGWFRHSPDGTIKYAENPPKKYQDIYPVDFGGEDAAERAELWQEWRRIFEVWIGRGVKIFRVDNPHTKPIAFWSWLIGEIQAAHPETIFLSEAFTKPKMMRQLAKVGFTQSYTYFTWRETASELREYLTELTQSEMVEYFRGNLFTNTPDINPHHLDHGRPAFVIRSVLAATLSSSYGVYSGWELCESDRLGEREEYLDSEKFEIRARDWDAKGNIKLLIGELNRLRRQVPALSRYENLRFENVSGSRTLFYRKALPHGKVDPLTGHPHRWRDAVFVAVNCDPTTAERAILHPDLPAIGIAWDEPYLVTDLLTGRVIEERGADLAVVLDPAGDSFRIFTIAPVDRGPAHR